MKVLKRWIDAAAPCTTVRVDLEGARPGQFIGAVRLALQEIVVDVSVKGHEILLSICEVDRAIDLLRKSGRPDLVWLAGELEKK